MTDNSSSTISIINNDSNISFSSNILNNTTTSHQAINNVTMQGNNVATANLQKPNDTNIFITNNDSIALQATIPPPPDITPLLIQQNFNNNMWSLSSQSQFKSTMPPPSLPTLSPSSLASTATSYRQQKSQKKMRCKNVSKPKQIKFHEYKGRSIWKVLSWCFLFIEISRFIRIFQHISEFLDITQNRTR